MVAGKMALLTDRRTKSRLKVLWIDDGQVFSVDNFLPLHVQFTWPVTPFTADRVAPEDGLFVAIDGSLDRHGLIGVAEQAPRFDGRSKCWFFSS